MKIEFFSFLSHSVDHFTRAFGLKMSWSSSCHWTEITCNPWFAFTCLESFQLRWCYTSRDELGLMRYLMFALYPMVPSNICASPSHLRGTVLAFAGRLWTEQCGTGDRRSGRCGLGCQPCWDDFEGLGMKPVPLVTPITTGRTGFKVVLLSSCPAS